MRHYRSLIRTAVLLTLGLFFSRLAWAYPIPPVPLWDLVEQSDLIVLADVSKLSTPTKERSDKERFPETVARLDVRETWKGNSADHVDVPFPANLVCPAPPAYLEGKLVLAFLAWESRRWITVGLSYGTLYPTSEDVDDYRTLVKKAAELQTTGFRPVDRQEWLVDTASRRGTRWHGLYELLPRADRLHSYYDRSKRKAEADLLGPEQLTRIAEGFVKSPSLDRTLPMALALFEGHPDQRVDEAAVSAIEALFAHDDIPWWIPDAIVSVFRRYGDRAAEARITPLGGTFDDRDPETVRQIWRNAKTELGIPDIAPAKIPDPEVWGVGSNTPS